MKSFLNILIAIWSILFGFNGSRLVAEGWFQRHQFDMSQWHLDQGEVRLDDHWFVVPNRLLSVENIVSEINAAISPSAQAQSLPITWDLGRNDGTKYGYVTYLLPIQLPVNQEIGIRFPKIFTAYKAYLVDLEDQSYQILASKGKVGTDRKTHISQELVAFNKFTVKNTNQILVIHASNFQLHKSGMMRPPTVGSFEKFQRQFYVNLLLKSFLFGLLFSISLYNLFIFLNRREDLASFWLFFLATNIALRILSTADLFEFVADQPSSLITELRYKTEYLTITLGGVASYCFFRYVFPKRFPKFLFNGLWFITIPFLLFLTFTSSSTFTLYLMYFQIILVISSSMTIICLLLVLIKRDTGWHFSVIAGAPLFAAVVCDVLIARGIIDFPYITQYGMVILIFAQSQLLGANFSKTYKMAKALSLNLQAEVQRQTQEIESKSQNIKSILENIKLGIFTIENSELKIGNDYSKHMEVMFKTSNIANQGALEFMFNQSDLTAEEKATHQAILEASISENFLNYTVNESNLKKEFLRDINGNESIIAVEWSPIVNRRDEIEKILVTLRDITDYRRLEQESSQNRERIQIISQLAEVQTEVFRKFFNNSTKLIQQSIDLLSSKNSQEILKYIFINIHTIKGNSRQIGLKGISTEAHLIEDKLSHLLSNSDDKSFFDLEDGITQLQSTLENYNSQYQRMFGQNQSLEFIERNRELFANSFIEVSSILADSADNDSVLNQLTKILYQLSYRNLKDILADNFKDLDRLAKDLKKHRPTVQLQGPDFGITYEGEDIIHNVFLHLLRNTMDHGIEFPDERLSLNKPEIGEIKIDIRDFEGMLQICYQDDGRGIDIIKLAETDQVQAFTPEKLKVIAELIFQDGRSTAESISEISGRGVGMGAIKAYVEKVGGNVKIVTATELKANRFLPFQLVISIPAKLYTALPTQLRFDRESA